MKILPNLWKWLSEQIVGDVPEGDAVCEFDCRNEQCLQGDWEGCDRRRNRAAGELMPKEKNTSSPRADDND